VKRLRALFRRPAPYDPDAYWEGRADDLIATYDAPETWAARGWTKNGVEEAAVPPLLSAAGARSAFVVGAGSGRQYAFLQPMGLDLRGLDISPTLAAECERRYPEIPTAVDTIVGAEQRHPATDAVLCTGVLQHIPPPDLAAAITSVKALAERIVVLRELAWMPHESDYIWAHDYAAAFSDWDVVVDDVTDDTERFRVRLQAWTRPG
jgi:SAM-dependent methyltransferase